MQAIGAVLAVPFGMTGAYSVYSSSLSTEATCKGLRGAIVAAIDKNVDLDTRRRLIRRDVEAFEHSCAAFDPDALEAFRIVLTKDGAAAAAVPPAAEAVPVPVPRPAPRTLAQPRRDAGHGEARITEARTTDSKATESRHADSHGVEARGLAAHGGDGVTGALARPVPLPAVPAPGPVPVPVLPPPLAEAPAPPPLAARAKRPAAWTPLRPPADVIGAPPPPEAAAPVEPAPWQFGHLIPTAPDADAWGR
jgi:hypothetical protein